jgi:thiol-disulfide isomerase/thioredoxin
MSRRLLVVPALVLALALSACGLSRTNGGGYITGDGRVDPIPASKQGDPIELSGTTLQGQPFDLASTRGKVTVINVWGAWCGQCMEEASDLQAAHEQLGADVPFLGLDIRETSLDLARAYEKNYGITYPSIHQDGDKEVLAFGDLVSPRTIPATIILDPDGVPVTIIRGAVPSTLTLVEAVQDVQKASEPSPPPSAKARKAVTSPKAKKP